MHHYFFDEIQKNTSVKIINILEETSNFALLDKPNKIGLMATNGTIRSKAYQRFINENILFIPSQNIQNKIMDIIYNKVKKNLNVNKEDFYEIINYFKDSGCNKVILGCTELSVVYKNLGFNDDFIVDSLTVLARKTVELSGKKLK